MSSDNYTMDSKRRKTALTCGNNTGSSSSSSSLSSDSSSSELEVSYSSLYNDANAARLDMENITSIPGVPCSKSQQILCQLRDNDPTLTEVDVIDVDNDNYEDDHCVYNAWIGYFIGKNVHLQNLHIDGNARLEYFFEGLSKNSSIRKLSLGCPNEEGRLGYLFEELLPFFKKNHNLAEIEVIRDESFGRQDYQLMAMAIGKCSGSLTKFSFENQASCYDGVGGCEGDGTHAIPLALSMHPKLREIILQGVDIGRDACIDFGTLFRNTATELEDLDITGSGLNDEGVLALVAGLSHCSKLSSLELRGWGDDSITNVGWMSISTLLENPNTNLEHLRLDFTTITDERTQMMATALYRNKKLKILDLSENGGNSTGGWSAFTKVVCDTTNINSTFQSNHTLNAVDIGGRTDFQPRELESLLALNADPNKTKVAMTKILKHHRHFNMEPFFEWNLKLLPLMISWLEQATDLTTDFETHIDERKFNSIHQFLHGVPMAIGHTDQI